MVIASEFPEELERLRRGFEAADFECEVVEGHVFDNLVLNFRRGTVEVYAVRDRGDWSIQVAGGSPAISLPTCGRRAWSAEASSRVP